MAWIDDNEFNAFNHIPFSRTCTLADGTGVVFGPAPSGPAGVWTEINPGSCLSDVILYGDATEDLTYSVDAAHAARLGDERALTLEAGKSRMISATCGKVAVWNSSGNPATVQIEAAAIRRENAGEWYPGYSLYWPLTCDEGDVKCDASIVTCDATYVP
jgi:hypothetical protein